jgi:acetyl/propionyl-CoA carboxylase alpha subunit
MTVPPRKILIANRGEIVRRIIRTARQLGLETVAVFSEPDAGSAFVGEADQAVGLGGETSAATYLDVEKILQAATATGADAVHPGYGFLAENADFARAVIDAGLTWIGPPPEAIALMGDKLAALSAMDSAGVPTLPRADVTGLEGVALVEAAAGVGYPLLVKPSAGGGGKGMAVIRSPEELADGVQGARRQSERAFGSEVVFLEGYLDRARHIEIQVIADQHGTVHHLFERECSIQRRHQKIIEEAPSTFLDSELRQEMCASAVAAATAAGYVSAGTVEFIVGEDRRFYFLEMNTRLQVEHPVTEMVTGLDLVRLQLEIARGEPLRLPALEMQGAAIEARLYAEDPANQFLPASGLLHTWIVPEGVRVDSGVEAGETVSPFYDPMLAKLIAYGPSREEAADRLAAALSQLRAQGLSTNRQFLINVLRHPAFLAGDTTIDFIERHQPAAGSDGTGEVVRRAAGVAALAGRQQRQADRRRPALPAGWRNVRTSGENSAYRHETGEIGVSFHEDSGGVISVTAGDASFRARVFSWSDPWIDVEIEGVRQRWSVTTAAGEVWVQSPEGEVRLAEVPRFPPPERQAAGGSLVAPMMGTVIAVNVEAGDLVVTGQTLAVIEAMKMEHPIVAPADGLVTKVEISAGETVATDQVIVVMEPASDPDENEAELPGPN